MKIKPEEILDFLGMSGVTSIEEFQDKFPSEFFRQSAPPDELKQKITGMAFKTVNKAVRETLNSKYGIELSNSQVEGKPLEEVVSMVLDSVKSGYDTKISDLEKQINEPNEAIKDWEKKYSKLENKYKETEGLLNTTVNEYNGYKSQKDNEIKSFKINTGKKDLFGKIPFKSDITEIERKGFDTIISENYVLDIDDNDEYIITDKKGQRIPNEKVVGTFKKPEDIFKEKAIELNLVATNQHAKNNTNVQSQQVTTPQQQAGIGRQPAMKPFGLG